MKLACSVLALSVAWTAAGVARAQPPDQPSSSFEYAAQREQPLAHQRLPAPRNAFELTVSTGYTQGFGNLQSGVGMGSVVTPGIGFGLQLGYRATEQWAVLWSGEMQEFTSERASWSRGYSSAVVAEYHFAPIQRVDPLIEFGAGYRLIWEFPTVGPAIVTHGFELARFRAALDFRASDSIALGPMAGMTATMFLFQDAPNVKTNIADPRLSTFIFIGMQGRFDMGGTRKASTPEVTASAR